MRALTLVAVLLAGSPGAATQERLASFSEAYQRAASSRLACEVLAKALAQAEPRGDGQKRQRPDEWGRPLRFACAKKKVCSDGPDCKAGTRDDLCQPLEGAKDAPAPTELGEEMLKGFVALTEEFAPGYQCEDLKAELNQMRVGDSWRRLLRVDCRWRLVCSDGPDGVQSTPDDLCDPMR